MRFKSKHHAMNQRVHSWGCLGCSAAFDIKYTICPNCKSPVQYFPSRDELRRYRQLQMEQRAGLISGLQVQPKYTVVLNGIKICEYRADFKYLRDGHEVIEDVKGTLDEKYLDPVFKLKRKMVEAIYSIKITLVKA